MDTLILSLLLSLCPVSDFVAVYSDASGSVRTYKVTKGNRPSTIYHTHGQRSLYFPNCELCISLPLTWDFNTMGTPSLSFFNMQGSPIKSCILTQTKIYSQHNNHRLSESGCQKITSRNQYSQFSPFIVIVNFASQYLCWLVEHKNIKSETGLIYQES